MHITVRSKSFAGRTGFDYLYEKATGRYHFSYAERVPGRAGELQDLDLCSFLDYASGKVGQN